MDFLRVKTLFFYLFPFHLLLPNLYFTTFFSPATYLLKMQNVHKQPDFITVVRGECAG